MFAEILGLVKNVPLVLLNTPLKMTVVPVLLDMVVIIPTTVSLSAQTPSTATTVLRMSPVFAPTATASAKING